MDDARGDLDGLPACSDVGLAEKRDRASDSGGPHATERGSRHAPVDAKHVGIGRWRPGVGGDEARSITSRAPAGTGRAPRIAIFFVFAGMIANWVIAHLAYGDNARVLFGRHDWMADFVKHTMSFPGPPIAPSMLQNLIDHFRADIAVNAGVLGHFHNMPETVLLTLLIRPAISAIDPVLVYLLAASVVVAAWVYVCHRHADEEARPQALGIALFNYPLALMLERGNLFAGITAICLVLVLCRRKRDWSAVLLLAVAANIRPNIAIIALPLLACDRETFVFLARTAALGALLAFACLAADALIYPAYNLSSLLDGLKLYNDGYVIGPFGGDASSSLWGALRHAVPLSGTNVALCTVAGLVPLGLGWLWRSRLSYAAMCFLAIAACTLSTAVLADYHLLVFIVPLLALKRDDPAFWPILLGSCWMLMPKNYNPVGELSWQVFYNPAGLAVAVLLVLWSCRRSRAERCVDKSLQAHPPASSTAVF